MSIYRLDLDALEETKNEYEFAATKISENIDTSYTVIGKTNIDIFSGIDGNTFRTGFNNFVSNDFTQLYESLSQMKTILTDGLDDARDCKKICNDFIISLGGESTGKSEADIHGEFYCDQPVISDLIGYCRSALDYPDSIRTKCSDIEDTLLGLRMVKLNPTPYTCVIREGCDKVDRLDDHSRELVSYASKAEMIDDSFKSALDGFSAPFLLNFNFSFGIYAGGISPQAENIIEIMSQKADLTDDDKKLLDYNLRIMEGHGDIEGLQKIAEHAGNGEDGTWTEGDIYVVARVYKYAENNANAELATVVYDKMKVVKCDKTINSGNSRRPPYTTFSYEFKLDEHKVADILAQLDPDEDGLAYYSLQRRSKYYETKIINKNGTNVKDPEMDLTIQFTHDESGRLVSIFTVDGKETRLTSVDMNEVVGQEWEKSSMKGMGFSEEERIALMSSIYTDEDVFFVRDLVNAETQSDYCNLFLQYDPDTLGITTTDALYQYSYGLVNHTFAFNDEGYLSDYNLEQFEKFVNGLLETHVYVADNLNDYLASLASQSSLQMDSIAWSMSENLQNKDKLNVLIPNFELNSRLYGLYAGLLSQQEYYAELGVSNIGNCMQISKLEFAGTQNAGSSNGIIDITETNFEYYENIMWKDYDGELQKCFDEDEESSIALKIYSGNDSLSIKKSVELIAAEKEKRMAVPKTLIKTGISVASVFQPWVGVVAGAIEGVAELDYSATKDAAKDALGIANDQYFEGSGSGKAGIAVIDGLADSIISYQEAKRKIDSIQSDIKTSLFGEVIVLRGTTISVVEEGIYTSNSLLKQLELEKNGLSFMVKEKKEDVAKLIMDPEINDGENKQLFLAECTTLENNTSLQEDEIVPALYLVWTGKPYEYEDGTKSELDSIKKLEPSEIEGCMSSLDIISNKMIVDHKKQEVVNITAEDYKKYNILEQK